MKNRYLKKDGKPVLVSSPDFISSDRKSISREEENLISGTSAAGVFDEIFEVKTHLENLSANSQTVLTSIVSGNIFVIELGSTWRFLSSLVLRNSNIISANRGDATL